MMGWWLLLGCASSPKDTGADSGGALCPAEPPTAEVEAVSFDGDDWQKLTGFFFIEESASLWGMVKAQSSVGALALESFSSTDSQSWTWAAGCAIPVGEPGSWRGDGIADPSILIEADGARVWYRADGPDGLQSVALATAADRCSWQVSPEAVFSPSEPWAALQVIAPHVIPIEGGYRMYYRGSNYSNQMQSAIGLATSADGLSWTPWPDNPLLAPASGTWDDSLLADPHVWQAGDRWLMLYSGHATPTEADWTEDEVGLGKYIGLAASADGLSWTRCGDAPLITTGTKADNPFVWTTSTGTWVYWRSVDTADGFGGEIFRLFWPDWP